MLAVLAAGSSDSNTSSSSSSNSESPAAAPEEVSDISWETIDAIYNLKYKDTDLRKDEAWKQFKGKRVVWAGRVREVSETFGSLMLQVRMNPESVGSDVILTLKNSERSKATRLQKDDPVIFAGTLNSWGSIMPISLKDGEIRQ